MLLVQARAVQNSTFNAETQHIIHLHDLQMAGLYGGAVMRDTDSEGVAFCKKTLLLCSRSTQKTN